VSSRPQLLVTRVLPDAVLERLRRAYAARLPERDGAPAPGELIARSQDCDAILCAPGDPLQAAVIEKLGPRVRALATFSVGYDHIDLTAARARGLAVFHTPDVLTDATAEIALLLLLGAARRAWEGQTLLRSGHWGGWAPTQLMGRGLTGKRLGILGMGRIGQAVARRARAFGCHIHYCNRERLPPELEGDARFHADPEDLLRHCELLSLHCPATEQTWHFLDARRLALLPRGAVVVNSARGALIDDEALIEALRSGQVAAAGLDVYEGEPALNPGYLALDNAFLLPHLGSATVEARNAMGFLALDNLDAFFAGRPAPARVA
jgi:lactate dehydrogenase-like 2-hydroxyacid dehydrogenase